LIHFYKRQRIIFENFDDLLLSQAEF